MLSEPKFYEKAGDFVLYPSVNDQYYTLAELKEAIALNQTDKNGKLVVLYASNKETQHSYIEIAKEKGYEVILLDSPIVSHLIQKLESDNQNLTFTRVDSDHIDKLIQKEDTQLSKLSEEETTQLKTVLEELVPKANYKRTARTYGQYSRTFHHYTTRVHAPYERNEPVRWWWDVWHGQLPRNVQFGGEYQF